MRRIIASLEEALEKLVSLITPEMAFAGGMPFYPKECAVKPSLILCKGEATPNISAPPVAPPVVLTAPPPPPAPIPAPQSTNSADVALAQQQSLTQAGNNFGFQSSLLGQGNDSAQNAKLFGKGGVPGSLLGNK